ncbi:MAG: STAS domain-containing protein [Phycisphaerae bacterium]
MTSLPPIDLQVDIQEAGGCVFVSVDGSVGVTEADVLRSRLEPVARSAAPIIAVDLSKMDFISSPGLSVLLKLAQRARTWDGQVKLVSPRPIIRDLLNRTRLTEIFPICETREDAIQ